jgi:hypothetical protein
LFNPTEPVRYRLHEKPEHRSIIFMKAAGASVGEIAATLGMKYGTVNDILKQPWARARLVTELARAGRDQIESTLSAGAVAAARRLVKEVDNMAAKPAERIQASRALLDRVYGTPHQSVSVEHSEADVTQLTDDELQAIVRRGSGSSITPAS